ncbi:MAG: rRNA pseudouridine synthase [Rhodococcus sp.]|nr:rRNA pseudouridine synthase [Rhodococcus sp. (in: high G+C Gram-positive bacteria)]
MKTPARRDGTPDRNKRSSSDGRRSSDRRGSSERSSSSDRSSSFGRSSSSDRRHGSERGQAERGNKPQFGKSPARGSGAPAGRGKPAGAGRPGSAAAATNKNGKPKTAKPRRVDAPIPRISNAKPARNQYVEDDRIGGHPQGDGVRLQKVLAQAGVASRRAAEDLISQGRVEVDGRIVVEQGLRIDPENAVVRVDGIRVVIQKDLVHLALNKPRGWQSTMSDDLGRPCVGDIVSERVAAGQRLFHVGRLDADTEGLLLLTNDGDLAHRLMHPSFEVSKTYLATVQGHLAKGVSKQLREGVELEDGPASVDAFTLLDVNEGKSLVRVSLHEGRKHIVRRLFDAVDHPVVRLVRTDIGAVALGDQRPGTLRVLGRGEVGGLYKAVGL